jgi:Rnk N-terminus
MRNRAICANVGVMKDTIYITSQDKQRLEELLAEAAVFDPRKQGDLKALEEELRRAVIVDPKEAPADVITMNSRAELIDLDSGETVTFTLVFHLTPTSTRRGFRCSPRSARECWGIALATSSNGRCLRVFAG